MKNRVGLITAFLAAFLFISTAAAQSDSANNQIVTCTFDDGNEISVRYTAAEFKKGFEVPSGKPWAPNGVAMVLFTPTDLQVGGTTVPTGAYTMYLNRNKNDWTLIVSKNVKETAPYDPSLDLAKVSMGTGRLSSPKTTFSATLGHLSPKVCSIQVSVGETGAFADFVQK